MSLSTSAEGVSLDFRDKSCVLQTGEPIAENIQNEQEIGEQIKNIEIPENPDINEVCKVT